MDKKMKLTAISLLIISLSCGKDKSNQEIKPLEEKQSKEIAQEKLSLTERDPFAGIYGIWYGANPAVLNSEYLTGGQIMVQWKDCEPTEGNYDFSIINTKLIDMAQRGLKTTVQINGNHKPDYLFTKVPYLPENRNKESYDELGSLMFWHSAYEQYYLNFISAYADFIKSSPYKNSIVGVRQNWNALGTEGTSFTGINNLVEEDWIIPQGVSYEHYSAQKVIEYQRKVMARFLEEFTPDIQLFVRTNVPDELIKENEEFFNKGLAGWFHTGSAMEQNQHYDQLHRYERFIKYCKPGTTFGYCELISGRVKPYSEIQWEYWRTLNELHCGISYIAMRPAIFEKAHSEGDSRFIKVLEFADKYAGYHALPAISPGAWIAFRGKGDNFPWDYTFLMESIDNSSLIDLKPVGSDVDPYGAWAQKLAVGGRILLDFHDDFYSADQRSGGVKATLRVIYYDSGTGSWAVRYDASGDPAKIARQVTNQNTNQWKILELPVNDGYFDNRAMEKADIVIENIDAGDLVLHMVELLR
jgi:hypothetical protein